MEDENGKELKQPDYDEDKDQLLTSDLIGLPQKGQYFISL
jgi:hypothetical protein